MTMQFQGFKPEAQKRIASTLGYTGDMSNFNGYLKQNPDAKQKMDMYNQQAVKMMQGGMVRKNFVNGGVAEFRPRGGFRATKEIDLKSGEPVNKEGNGIGQLGVLGDGSQLLYSGYQNYGYGNPRTGPKYTIISVSGDQSLEFSSFQDAMSVADPRYVKDDTPEYRTPNENFIITKSKLQNDVDTGTITQQEFDNAYFGKFENFEQYQTAGSPSYNNRLDLPEITGTTLDLAYGGEGGNTGTTDPKGSFYTYDKQGNRTGAPQQGSAGVEGVQLTQAATNLQTQQQATEDATPAFSPSSNYNTQTGEFYDNSNTYGTMKDGSILIQSGDTFQLLNPSGSAVVQEFSNFQEAMNFADPSANITAATTDTATTTGTTAGTDTATGTTTTGVTDDLETTGTTGTTGTGTTGTTTDTTGTAVTGSTGTTLTQKDDTVNQPVNTSDITGTNQAIPTATTPVALTNNTGLEVNQNQSIDAPTTIADISAGRVVTPELPTGTAVEAVGTAVTGQQIVDNTAGAVSGNVNTQVQQAAQSGAGVAASTMGTSTVPQGSVSKVAGSGLTNALATTKEAVGAVDPRAKVRAETDTTTAVSSLRADDAKSIDVSEPTDRRLQSGELVTGSANAANAATFTEKVQAKTATPTTKATVEGQLEQLMSDFDGGKTPVWASGAMRAATAAMAQRGLGASSMAGQAIVQAAMEASLPIAIADAQTFASFEAQNLSNKQERAMLSAQQRATFMGQEFDQKFQARVMNASKISEIANTNLTADQQIALENSRAANTVNLANLSNDQALTLSEAAALSNLEIANLSNSQQAVVLNAQNLMQMDMANLTNAQQTSMFKGQQRTAAIFSDAAALNAAKQFNATSKNQADQFFANLKTQNSQFNVAQTNGINQYNAGEVNAQSRFTSEMMNQREQFNANNKLVVEQSNAVWRREIGTADTAAINRTNELNASALLDVSNTAYNNMWQYYADTMEYAFTSANDERERMTELAIAKLQVDSTFDIAKWQSSAASSAAIGQAMIKIATTDFDGDTLLERGVDWLVEEIF